MINYLDFFQVDIESPEKLEDKFSEMCPIIKNDEIKFEDIGEYRQKQHNKNVISFKKVKSQYFHILEKKLYKTFPF